MLLDFYPCQDLEANEARITNMNGQAGKLLADKHPDADVISGRREVRRWSGKWLNDWSFKILGFG